MKLLTVIPARGGSKGIPGKNIKLLGGKPLIHLTIESAIAAGLNHIVVNSDDDVILDSCKRFDIDLYKRPAHLATDAAKSIDVIIDMLEGQYADFDSVLLLQATYPFRPLGFIEQAINKYLTQSLDSLISVLPVPHQFNPHWVFKPNEQGILGLATGEESIISRRQDLPPAYYRDGAIYLSASEIILDKHSFFGQKLGFIESDIKHYVNIDTMADWDMAEDMVSKRNTPDGNG